MQNFLTEDKADGDCDDNQSQYLTFVIAGKDFGLPIVTIREIISYGEITEVPMMPNFMSGVINLRGRALPVIDMGVCLSGEKVKQTKRTSIVITQISNEDIQIDVGLVVDMVCEVMAVEEEDVEPALDFGNSINTSFMHGMVKVGNRFLILLDIRNILSTDDMAIVGAIQENHKVGAKT